MKGWSSPTLLVLAAMIVIGTRFIPVYTFEQSKTAPVAQNISRVQTLSRLSVDFDLSRVPDPRPEPAAPPPLQNAASVTSNDDVAAADQHFTLIGIARSKLAEVAIVQFRDKYMVVRSGDQFENVKIMEIGSGTVHYRYRDEAFAMELGAARG